MSVLSFYTFVPRRSRLVCLSMCEVLSVLMPSFANCPPPSADVLLGACGTLEGKGVNLGYIQSSPQVASDGSISIVYLNGDRCDKGHHSTRIIFQCDDNPVSDLHLLSMGMLFHVMAVEWQESVWNVTYRCCWSHLPYMFLPNPYSTSQTFGHC